MHQVSSGRRSLLVAGMIVLGGCASAADLHRVRLEQKEMQARLADTQATVDSLKQRVDALRTTVTESKPAKRPPGMAELEQRLAALEGKTEVAGAPPTPTVDGGIPPVARAAAQIPRTDAAVIVLRREEPWLTGGTVSETYRKGLEQYRAGQCDQAITTFRQFIRNEPSSDLADNAQFWIGECYYARKDYNRAIIELNEVFTKYPKGDRVPSGLLALATSFADSGDAIDARLILQKLINDHAKTEEAEIGRQKLKTLTD